jgi:hypothetical protein
MNELIPELPPDLRVVPGPVAGERPPDDGWRRDWYAWRERLVSHREQTALRCHDRHPDHEANRIRERWRCAEDPAYFVATWCPLFEPRRKKKGSGNLPFAPYAFQVEVLRWFQWMMTVDVEDDEGFDDADAVGDGLVSKSRDLGFTWIMCAYVLWAWIFTHPFDALLLSRKEDLVDKKNLKDSLFAKIEFMYAGLPAWMVPKPVLERGEDRLKLTITNPLNGNTIVGESTNKDAGVGGRYTFAGVDEGAKIDALGDLLASLANSTDHIVVGSTETFKHGEDFYKRRQELPPANVRELDWWLAANHTDVWYENMKRRLKDTPEKFAEDVDRNPFAAYGSIVYAQAFDLEKDAFGDFPWEPGMGVYVGIDPGFADECAMQIFAFDAFQNRYRLVFTYVNQGQTPEFYASIMAGIVDPDPLSGFDYRDYGRFRTMEALAFFAELPAAPWMMGDPYGNNRVTGINDSWYSRMVRHFGKLRREAGHPVTSLPYSYEMQREKREHQGRRFATMRLFPRVDFNEDPTVRYTIEAFKHYRFEANDRPRQVEQAVPKHTWASHPVTAFEYAAVGLEGRRTTLDRDLTPYKVGKRQKVA